MTFEKLFRDIDYRFAPDSPRETDSFEITDVITSPKAGAENAVYVVTKTALQNGYNETHIAYAMGCRLFVAPHDSFPGEEAVVLICEEPQRVLGELASRVYGHPERDMSVIGVTGTAGKTSVTFMLEHILRVVGKRVGSVTTDGISINGCFTPAAPIVPDAAELRRILAKMRGDGVEFALVECSAYQLRHAMVEGISFLCTALTNLSPRHIGKREFEEFTAYRAAKETLLLSPAAVTVLPVGVESSARGRVVRCGTGGDLSVTSCERTYLADGRPAMRFMLCEGEESVPVLLPVHGDFAVQNALTAAALARVAGISLKAIGAALKSVEAHRRMECVYAGGDKLVFLDSAFDPEGVQAALEALLPLVRGRLCVLLGSVGRRALERRAPLGRTACQYADFVYLTADDPATEDPAKICAAMRDGMAEPERCCVIPDRRRAIVRAVRELRAGDVLLILCKGRQDDQLCAHGRVPFSERDVVLSALEALV